MQQFFENGGSNLYVVRVANNARGALLCLPASGSALVLRAMEPGSTERVRAAVDYDGISARSGRDAAESAVAIAAAHLRSSMRVAGEFIGRLGPGCVAAMRRSSDEEQVRAQTRSALRAAQIGMAFGTAAPSRTDCELRLGVAVCAPAAGVRQAIAESLRSSEIIDARIAGPRVLRATRPDSTSLPRKSYSMQRHSSFRRA